MKVLRTLTHILCLTIAFSFYLTTNAQSIKRDKFDWNRVLKPLYPVQQIKSVSMKFYFPNELVNQDTIWAYTSKVDVRSNLGIEFKEKDLLAYHEIDFVNADADINLEVAFQALPHEDKRVQKVEKSASTSYSYAVTQRMPTVVRVTNRSGEIIDMWVEDDYNVLKYGDQKENKIKKTETGFSGTLGKKAFFSEEALEKGFAADGERTLMRLGVLAQIGKVIGSLYPRLYGIENEMKLALGYPKSNKHDYSELEATQTAAIEAIESGNLEALGQSIATWEASMKEYDRYDRKAKINTKVQKMLVSNIIAAYMAQDDFGNAYRYLPAYQDLVEGGEAIQSNLQVSTTGSSANEKQLDAVLQVIPFQYRANRVNPDLEFPAETFKPYDFEKQIERRGKLSDYDLFFVFDKVPEFTREYEAWRMENTPKTENEAPADAVETASVSNAEMDLYAGMVVNPNTYAAQLMFNSYTQESLTGKPMSPAAVMIAQKTGVAQLFAVSMKFTSLPANIGDIATLKQLNLNDNSLTSIPESIGNLAELKTLNLANNQLTSLPESIKNCKNLKKLVLKNNNISPEEMSKIKSWIPEGCKVK